MAIVITAESEYGKELSRWNTPKSQGGMRPDGIDQYPKMLYKAQTLPNGKTSVGESNDYAFGGALGAAAHFNKTCQRIVKSEAEHSLASSEGWKDTPAEALEYVKRLEDFIAEAAAHRAFEERNMSPAALKEASEAEAETHRHLAEIPEKRRERKPTPDRGV